LLASLGSDRLRRESRRERVQELYDTRMRNIEAAVRREKERHEKRPQQIRAL
jgi:hypothetical protein